MTWISFANGLMILIGIFHCGNACAEVSAIDFEKEGPVELLARLTEHARLDASLTNILIARILMNSVQQSDSSRYGVLVQAGTVIHRLVGVG